jgi:hypothetical protein
LLLPLFLCTQDRRPRGRNLEGAGRARCSPHGQCVPADFQWGLAHNCYNTAHPTPLCRIRLRRTATIRPRNCLAGTLRIEGVKRSHLALLSTRSTQNVAIASLLIRQRCDPDLGIYCRLWLGPRRPIREAPIGEYAPPMCATRNVEVAGIPGRPRPKFTCGVLATSLRNLPLF